MNKVNLVPKVLSPRLCSCPQEIDFLDQYVSHPTHALRSPGIHSSDPGATARPSRRTSPCTGSQYLCPEVTDPCSHQHAPVV